jgi:hypothetical protein
MSQNPKCNQQGIATTFGWPSAADVAKVQQAKHAAYRANERKLAEAKAKAEALKAADAETRAARTRDATQRSLFWHSM